ncbi:MAG: type II toxin-antitoxin system VapC family toxin [Opitutaceae bacterium]|nr:type II toxin-antitoxin system VapC family toxin [Opitutaceae bacterium]
MIYWDTSYLAKLYLREAGTDDVLQAFAGQGGFVCGEHGRLELLAAFKRNQREGLLTAARLKTLWEKHAQDEADGLVEYLPLSSPLIQHACQMLFVLPPTIFLRASDALHLACAADAGLKEIYSHDRHLLAAAPHFGLKGLDVIKPA